MRPSRAACLGVAFACAASLSATTYTVTTTADSGAGSLRQAVADANGAAGPHTIAFNIAGSGPHSIALASDLPAIAFLTGITIDGTTQPGFAGTPLIEIYRDGTFGSTCLTVQGTPTTIKALAINRCGTGINSSSGGSLTLLGSRLGTDPSGTVALANIIGVSIINGTPDNVIGGPNPADRNIFANHSNSALLFNFASTGTVRGNFFGVDATGTVAMPNFAGVNCNNGSGLVIGGGAPGQGNLISGSTGNGILLQSCNNAVVQGNLIGTDVTGMLPIPNKRGIEANVATNLKVGGTGAGEGNVVGASVEMGLRLTADTGVIVQGNSIGTEPTGTAQIGNRWGIELNGTSQALIGPDTPGGPGANEIAYNTVGVTNSGNSNTVRGNSIHDNAFLGLDVSGGGVNANDIGDVDPGQPNFPNVTSAVVEGAGVRVIGVLESNASSTFDLDFYSNPACSRFPQDYLEGEQWIGTAPVTTDGSGHAAFDVLFSPVTVPAGFRVTATSTTADGSTSEFSQRIVLTSSPLTGNTAGSSVLVQGMQFENGATVTVGGVAATNVQWQSAGLIQAQAPALAAGSINNVVVTNPSGLSGTLPNAYVSSFTDTESHPFRQYIGGLVANGLTVGCGVGIYCPQSPVTRQQMAVFLLRGKLGLCYTPPPCTGAVFDDVQCAGNPFAAWVEALDSFNITGGCGGNNFCPTNPVNRQQMAVFLLKALEGSDYVPPACANPTFTDVPCSNPFSPWIYELALRQITGGCGANTYCPTDPANRGQMAVFLVKTFSLPFL